MAKGAMTDVERERYRQARASAAIVRVGSALCFPCIQKRIGRYIIAGINGVYQVQDTCCKHIHMTLMCGNAITSAVRARAARAALAQRADKAGPR